MHTDKSDAPLNQIPCPQCGKHVDDRAVACPFCGEKIYVEHPGGITPTKHRQLEFLEEPGTARRSGSAETGKE